MSRDVAGQWEWWQGQEMLLGPWGRAEMVVHTMPPAQGGAIASQRSFQNFPSREPMRRMHRQELKAELSLDRLQLEALHRVSGAG